jgi:hypothetical protein
MARVLQDGKSEKLQIPRSARDDKSQKMIRFFLPKPKSGKVKQAMVEELEQEYAALKDKVRDLREYL